MWPSLAFSVGGLRPQSPLPTRYVVWLPGGKERGLNCTIQSQFPKGTDRDNAIVRGLLICACVSFPVTSQASESQGLKPYLLFISCQMK